jgi:hypothetical protein
VHAFVDGYHTGLLVTIALLAVGVGLSYVTLRPRAKQASTTSTTSMPSTTGRPESVAVAELATVDELAAELAVD